MKSVVLDGAFERALTASFDYTVMLWQLDKGGGRPVRRLAGHEAAVNDVAFVPNGAGPERRAVSVSDDGAFGIWDLETGSLVKLIKGPADKMLDVAVSPDGKWAAAARWDNTARLYDIAAGREVARFEGHRSNVNAVAFSLDGKVLFTGSYDGDVRAWHVEAARGGAWERLHHGQVIHSHGWGVNVLTLLPGGRELVFGAIDGTLGVIDIATGNAETIAEFDRPVLSLAVSARAGLLAAGGGDGHIRVFDTETMIQVEDRADPYGPVWSLAFNGEGTGLYRAGLDDFVGYWQFVPRKPFELSESTYPRRFQVRESDDPGMVEFQRKCSICHTLTPEDANRAGPTLYGIFGRKAGSVAGYPYSPALTSSDITWNEKTIGRLFDDGPDVVVPGTKMPVQRLKSVTRRDALIGFLKKATRPGEDAAK